MANQALMLANNLRHKVAVPVAHAAQMSLMALAAQSFRTQVTGQLEGTVDARSGIGRHGHPSRAFNMSRSTRRW